MPVHEQVSISLGRLGIKAVPTDIVVRHTGYTTPDVVRAKQERYFEIMRRWLEHHPDDYIVRHHQAQTYYVWGELDKAIEDYQRILDEGKAARDRNLIIQTTAHLSIGRCLMRKEAFEEALPSLQQALKLDDHYSVTHLTLGECYLRLKRYEEATHHLKEARLYEDQVTFAPNDPNKVKAMVRLFLGQAYEGMGDVEKAARLYEESASTGVAEVLGPLSTALRRLGRKEDARRALVGAAEHDPENPNHPFNLGVMALEAGDLDGAEALFLRATQSGEGLPQAFLNLGFIYKKRGSFEQAEAMYSKAAQGSKDATEAHANLGHLHLSLRRYSEAAEAFRRVREGRADLLDVNLGLALALARKGEVAEVRAMLGSVLLGTYGEVLSSSVPGEVPAEGMSKLFSEVGRMLVGKRQPKCAEFAFEIAWTLDPGARAAGQCLAEVLRHSGEIRRAVEVYEALIRTSPEEADLFRKLGACYRELKADAAAEACDQQAARIEGEA